MTEFSSLYPVYFILEHQRLVYSEASGILEDLFGKARNYLSFDDFFHSVLKDNFYVLRRIYLYHTKDPRMKINLIKEPLSPYCKLYIRAPSDANSINILKLHLLIFEIVSEVSQTSSCQSPIYEILSDGAIYDNSQTDELCPNEKIPEQLYSNLKILYSYICDHWIVH